ncbi:putative ammonium transporter 1 [Convolutriloba macropyga]|uniref:putative ammonium transporter 1 n=1 Tax=Convolutriloba macropyga TaxID=536237 RepID=UPI003F51D252
MASTGNGIPLSEAEWAEFKHNMDDFYVLITSVLKFLMAAGFAFLEMGAIRSKNTTNILMKNILDSCIASIIYWVCGYAFAFGSDSNAFCGYSNFLLIDLPGEKFSFYFFHFVFAATAVTIVSGAMAERTQLRAYFMYSFFITGFVYPIVAHWAWSETGWLKHECWWEEIQFQDFSGSGVVHMVGGAAGLMGTLALGPRLDQYVDGKRQRVKGHTVPMMSLGAFIIFFGFFAFNGGSQASITKPGDSDTIANILKNTILSGASGGLFVVILFYIINRKFTLLGCINGMITGMVAIGAGCNVIDHWGACVTGIIGGFVFVFYSELLFKLGVDDPLDAMAVHFGGGSWGLMSVALFAKDVGVVYQFDEHSFKVLLWNFIGGLAITAWTFATTGTLFFTLRALGFLRVSELIERNGLDVMEHGEVAYPADAYLDDDFFKKLKLHGNSATTGDFQDELDESHHVSVAEVQRKESLALEIVKIHNGQIAESNQTNKAYVATPPAIQDEKVNKFKQNPKMKYKIDEEKF